LCPVAGRLWCLWCSCTRRSKTEILPIFYVNSELDHSLNEYKGDRMLRRICGSKRDGWLHMRTDEMRMMNSVVRTMITSKGMRVSGHSTHGLIALGRYRYSRQARYFAGNLMTQLFAQCVMCCARLYTFAMSSSKRQRSLVNVSI
jgi:hypothetical protein